MKRFFAFGLWGCLQIVLTAAACGGPGTTPCGEATCPRGYSCDPVHELCVVDSQLADCVGLPDGTACTVRGAGGYVCDQEVCIPVSCGDGYVTYYRLPLLPRSVREPMVAECSPGCDGLRQRLRGRRLAGSGLLLGLGRPPAAEV